MMSRVAAWPLCEIGAPSPTRTAMSHQRPLRPGQAGESFRSADLRV